MGHIFSKKPPKSKITEQDKAVLQLKQQRDKLKQYQRRIETKLESDRLLAKNLIADGKKDRARLLLQKKRYQENLLRNTDNQLENLERLTHDIEFAQIEVKVVEGLKQGNEALKKVNDMINIEDVERILDETREGAEKQEEINALLSGVLSDEDDEAVMKELDELVEEMNVPLDRGDVEMPEVPSDEIEVPEKQREKTKKRKEEEPIAMEA